MQSFIAQSLKIYNQEINEKLTLELLKNVNLSAFYLHEQGSFNLINNSFGIQYLHAIAKRPEDTKDKFQILEYISRTLGKERIINKEIMDVLYALYTHANTEFLKRRILIFLHNEYEYVPDINIQNIYFEVVKTTLSSSDEEMRVTKEFGIRCISNLIKWGYEKDDIVMLVELAQEYIKGTNINEYVIPFYCEMLESLATSDNYGDFGFVYLVKQIEQYYSTEKHEEINGVRYLYHDPFRKSFRQDDHWRYEKDIKKRLVYALKYSLEEIKKKDAGRFEKYMLELLKGEKYHLYNIYYNLGFILIDDVQKNPKASYALFHSKGYRPQLDIENNIYGERDFMESYLLHNEKDRNIFEAYLLESGSELFIGKSKEYIDQHIYELLYAIPDELRTVRVKDYIQSYEKRTGYIFNAKDYGETDGFEGSNEKLSLSIPHPDEFKISSFQEYLIHVLPTDLHGLYDQKDTFTQYIEKYPDMCFKILDSLLALKGKHGVSYIQQYVAITYVENLLKNKDIKDFYVSAGVAYRNFKKYNDSLHFVLLDKLNTNECLRSNTTKNLGETLRVVKEIVYDAVKDGDPEGDRGEEMKRGEDGITVGLNTVRGVGIQLLIVLLHHYPSDHDLRSCLLQIVENETVNSMKSTIIYNLMYLIKDNNDLCKKIIDVLWNQNERNAQIDFSFVSYLFHAGKKYRQHESTLKRVFTILENKKNANEDVQKNLGNLVGQVVILGETEYEEILKDMWEGKIGIDIARVESASSLISIGFKDFGKMKDVERNNFVSYFKLAISKERVNDRSVLLPFHEKVDVDVLPVLKDMGIFDSIFCNIGHNDQLAWHWLAEYLYKCLQTNLKYGDYVIDILYEWVNHPLGGKAFSADNYFLGDVAKVIEKLLTEFKLSKKYKQKIDDVFEACLIGGDEKFYAIFHTYYLKKA